MSCYFRHLNEIFGEAGIEVTAANKKQVDQAIHQLVGVGYKDCPAAWHKLKREITSDPHKRSEFIARLQAAIR